MPHLVECQNWNCRFRDYRLLANSIVDETMESMGQSGGLKCYKCGGSVKFRRIKFKTLIKLRELFPNKKVIYTKLPEGALLELPPDLDGRPYVTDENDVKD